MLDRLATSESAIRKESPAAAGIATGFDREDGDLLGRREGALALFSEGYVDV